MESSKNVFKKDFVYISWPRYCFSHCYSTELPSHPNSCCFWFRVLFRLTQTLARCLGGLGLEYNVTKANIRSIFDFRLPSPFDRLFFQLPVVGKLTTWRFASKMVHWIVISCKLNKKKIFSLCPRPKTNRMDWIFHAAFPNLSIFFFYSHITLIWAYFRDIDLCEAYER